MTSNFIEIFKNIASNSDVLNDENAIFERIEEAFANREFKTHLQFIVNNKTKAISSAEALSRWEISADEIVSPGLYLPLIEKAGLSAKFDYYMFESVCAKLAQWKNTEFGSVTVSCNFSRITLSENAFIETVTAIADKYDFDRKNLLIEITESTMERNVEVALDNVVRAKELGFRIALDDVGSGYTSLICLCKYPVDVVKIDREVLLLASEARGKKLLLGIIALSHFLNLEVVCEGVETSEQNDLISNSDCDYIQGWYYFKALDEKKAEECAREYAEKLAKN